MKVKILKSCRVAGKHVEAGRTADVTDKQARILISIKKAEVRDDKAAAEKAAAEKAAAEKAAAEKAAAENPKK